MCRSTMLMRKMFPVANTPSEDLRARRGRCDRLHQEPSGSTGPKRRTSSRPAGFCSISSAATCRTTAKRSKACLWVGRKTANVVLNTAFGHATIAVDTHIFRVANRTGLAPGKDVRAVETALEKFTPAEFMQDAHHWLILHGRYVCKARRPECWHCVIEPLCEFRPRTPPPDL